MNKCHYAKRHYAECRDLFIVILSVVMLNVVMLGVIMLSVVAPKNGLRNRTCQCSFNKMIRLTVVLSDPYFFQIPE